MRPFVLLFPFVLLGSVDSEARGAVRRALDIPKVSESEEEHNYSAEILGSHKTFLLFAL